MEHAIDRAYRMLETHPLSYYKFKNPNLDIHFEFRKQEKGWNWERMQSRMARKIVDHVIAEGVKEIGNSDLVVREAMDPSLKGAGMGQVTVIHPTVMRRQVASQLTADRRW